MKIFFADVALREKYSPREKKRACERSGAKKF